MSVSTRVNEVWSLEADNIKSEGLHTKQLEATFDQSPTETGFGIVAVATAMVATGSVLPSPIAAGWALLTTLVYGSRYMLVERRRRDNLTDANVRSQTHLFMLTVAITGICWGSFIVYCLSQTQLVASLGLLLIGSAVCAVSIASHVALKNAGELSTLTILSPTILLLILRRAPQDVVTAIGLALLGVAGILTTRIVRPQLLEKVALQERAYELNNQVDEQNRHLEKADGDLKKSQTENAAATAKLRRISADLGLAQSKSKVLSDALERVSSFCQVTGLPNRRYFEQLLDNEWRRAIREKKTISMFLLGIDGFEEYIDAYGSQAADTLIKRLATTFKGFGLRAGDSPGRYADQQLALLLPGCSAANAARMAEAIRKRVEALAIPNSHGNVNRVITVHIGVAMARPGKNLKIDALAERIEAAYYESGFNGGNRVVTYQPLNRLRLERWNVQRDGRLSEQTMMQKLLVWGYDTAAKSLPPGTVLEPEWIEEEKVLAVTRGELEIEIEDHTMSLKVGDCVFIPPGIELSLKVVGDEIVSSYTAKKNY